YHHRTRATAMAIHQTSVYTGIVFGGVLAAWIGSLFGWRYSFYVFGTLGAIWSFIVLLRLRNDQRDAARQYQHVTETLTKIPMSEVFRNTLGKPTFYFLSLAFGGHVFVNVGFLTWMPTFLFEKYHLSLTRASFDAMFYHHFFAYFGVLTAAAFSDYLAHHRKTVRMEIESLGMFLSTPFIFLMGYTENLWIVYVALCGFGIFRGVYDSNLFVVLFDIIEPKYRSTATGMMLSFAFVTGAVSPVALGWVKQNIGLEQGIMGLAVVYLLSSISIFIGLKTYFLNDYYTESANFN
ncbi:MAG: MFS transporter, partial [Planctomycetaceae bacterium]|nr:MFS transporter [Planctomycetaceae bacterium]